MPRGAEIRGGRCTVRAVQAGTHTLGPENATLQVRTYREGLASKAGHDLVIEVEDWRATVIVPDGSGPLGVQLSADPRSLYPSEGHGGAKPLSDKDRGEIKKSIDTKVLKEQPIHFRSNAVEPADGDGRLEVSGELSMGGRVRPVSFELSVAADGHVQGTVRLKQSEWGIKPYTALMGALKVRDDVEVVLNARLPTD